MGLEYQKIKEALAEQVDPLEPLFGKNKVSKVPMWSPKIKIGYFSGCVADPESRATLESILTRSLHCPRMPEKSGDICAISETGAFDKDGCYVVVIKYAYIPEDTHAERAEDHH